jgi:hypothetical protein
MFDNAGHGNATCSPFPTAYVGTESIMHDYNNASTFKTGQLVMSECELWRQERIADENPKRTAEAKNSNGSLAKVTFSGDFAGYFAYGLPNLLVEEQGNKGPLCLIEAYAKMNQSATLSGETIATMKQTIGMIRSPFGAMTKLAKRAQKRLKQRQAQIRKTYHRDRKRLVAIKAKPIRFTELAKALALDLQKAVADCWLELRYGMMPLAMDVETHLGYIQQKMRDMGSHNERRVARSSTRKTEKSDSYDGPVGCGLDYVYEPRAKADWHLSHRMSAGVVYSVSPQSNFDEVMGHMGLRLRDLPSTAWELIPSSFLVDWAINIGDWLQAIIPAPGITPLANWITTVESKTTTISGVEFCTYLGWGTNHKVSFSFPPGTEKTFSYVRETANHLPNTPMFLGKPLSNVRLGDAAALSVGKFVTTMQSLFKK